MLYSVVTWNVNSIKMRLNHLLQYIKAKSPDVILLQELKCISEQFPYQQVEDAGYNIIVNGQKTYNGVAILSKYPLEDSINQLPTMKDDPNARYVEALVQFPDQVLHVASVYVPNGQSPASDKFPYKLRFLDALLDHATYRLNGDTGFILGGDFNIAPENIDCFDPQNWHNACCFHPEEKRRFHRFTHAGFADSFRMEHPEMAQYSWWDYRKSAWQKNHGLRIDHVLVAPLVADRVKGAYVDDFMRDKEKASDHAPVRIEFAK